MYTNLFYLLLARMRMQERTLQQKNQVSDSDSQQRRIVLSLVHIKLVNPVTVLKLLEHLA